MSETLQSLYAFHERACEQVSRCTISYMDIASFEAVEHGVSRAFEERTLSEEIEIMREPLFIEKDQPYPDMERNASCKSQSAS
jgi:hypothetical protein